MKRKKMAVIAVITLVFLITGVCFGIQKLKNGSTKENFAENSKGETCASQEETTGKSVSEDEETLQTEYYQPALVAGDAEASAGEEVTVDVLVIKNPGILGMCFSLFYNEDVMVLKKVEEGEAFKDILDFSMSGKLQNGCRFLWDGIDIESDQIKDGRILQLTFAIKEDAPNGKYPITLLADNNGTVDRNLQTVDLYVDCSYVTIR